MQARDSGASGPGKTFYDKQRRISAARAGLHQLAAVMKNTGLFPPAHPFVLASAEQFLSAIDGAWSGGDQAAYYLVSGELFFDTLSVPLDDQLTGLIAELAARDVGVLLFHRGLTRAEIIRFAGAVRTDASAIIAAGGLSAVVKREQITHISIQGKLAAARRSDELSPPVEQHPGKLYLDAVETVKDLVQTAHVGKPVNSRRLQTAVHTLVDGVLQNRDALIGLTSIKLYDEYTFAHSVNVSLLSIALGTYLSFDKAQVAALGTAGMLHDIGKINIPREIINKPDKLSEQEWEVVRRHPIDGALMLSAIPGISRMAMVTAFEHHRHHGEAGYPKTAHEAGQHPFSQIVAIADAYDAIVSARVYYHAATPPDQAVRVLLAKRGSAFSPFLVKTFIKMIGLFPVGALLKLDTGESALVVRQTGDLLRPRVVLLTRFDGTEREETSLLDMMNGRHIRTPVATIDPASLKIDVSKYFA